MKIGRALVAGLLCVGLGAVAASPLSAQSAGLDRVQSLMDAGQFASARTELQTWLSANEATLERSARQRALWLRALLTVDPGMAELDYRRLVVEYPGGQHSDEALLRLAQIARARADDPVARQYLETLVRDHPRSPHRLEARAMIAEMEASPAAARFPTSTAPGAGDPVPADTATSDLTDVGADSDAGVAIDSTATSDATVAPEATGAVAPEPVPTSGPAPAVVEEPDIEEPEVEATAVEETSADDSAADDPDVEDPAADDLAIEDPDAEDLAAADPAIEDPAVDDPDSAAGGAPPRPDSAPYTVQLGAFSRPEGAATIAERAREAGFEARLVRVEGSDLIRVRSGMFPDVSTADSRAEELQAAGFEAVVASDRPEESEYSGSSP